MATRPQTQNQGWSDFKAWCVQRKLKALPAHPWTIAAYLRWIDRRFGAKDAQAAFNVISRQHVLKTMRAPMRHAIVARTLEMIERRGEVRDRQAALFDDQEALGQNPRPAPLKKAVPKPGRRVLSTEPRLKPRRPPAKG
jgi:hypothetical protein